MFGGDFTKTFLPKTNAMKSNFLFGLAVIAGMGMSVSSFAQSSQDTYLHCGATEARQRLEAAHPELVPIMRQQEQQLQQSGSTARSTQQQYVIPIVFHIIHDYGAENISDAQILDQVAILNRDYNKLNADTAAVVPEFQNIIADVGITFRLATLDPEGNCTNGIDRIASTQTYIGNDGSKLDWWPRDRYLNVWVVKQMANGVAGYAYLPPSTPLTAGQYDGVIILQDYIGSIGTSSVGHSRALTHEIGHYLGLQHTWGPTNQPGVACGDDGVTDTPETKGWLTCNLTNNKICDTAVVENVQNYMEYAYCSVMFTEGQKAVMLQTLNSNVADRMNLWQPANLTLTGTADPYTYNAAACVPIADFHPNYHFVCQGSTVTFNDDSWGGTASSLSWNFGPAGSPQTSTAATQNVVFNNWGWQTVSLTATNAAGTNTATKLGTVFVSPSWPDYVGPTSEGFENPTTVAQQWIPWNRNNNASNWHTVNAAAYTGNYSMMLNNYGSEEGDIDELITPAYDLQGMSSITMNFRYCMATATLDTSYVHDVLKIFTSTNCGQTWQQRGSISGTTLITAGYSTNFAFAPNVQSLWGYKSVNLGAVANQNVRFKFQFTSAGRANNLFLDDINITGVVGIESPAATATASVGIAPNPSSGTAQVNLHSMTATDAQVQVLDMQGRKVMDIFNGHIVAGETTFNVDGTSAGLSNGIYFIEAKIGDQLLRQKWLVTSDK